MGQIDDVIREGSLKEVLIIKKSHYMVVMRSAFWAQGWWLAEDPVLSGLESRGFISCFIFSTDELGSRLYFSGGIYLT